MANPIRDLYLYVPLPDLKVVARRYEVPHSAVRKLELVRELVQKVPSDRLQEVMQHHLCAGRGSVLWFRPTLNAVPVEFDNDEIVERLTQHCGSDPFADAELHPNLDHIPRIVNASIISDEKILGRVCKL